MIKINKRGFEFGFAWIFAIFVGAAILFLAIFSVSQFIDIGEREVSSKTAVEFVNVLDPLQSVISESSGTNVRLLVEARIFNSCNLDGNFGNTIVRFSEKIGFGGEWTKPGLETKTKNAYLFSEDKLEGDDVSFLSFPFKMPYKIGDIIIAYTDNYCIVNAPEEINSELKFLARNDHRIIFSNSINACPAETKSVCFSGSCDVVVNCEDFLCTKGFVRKNKRNIYFVDKLLYGAIFSSIENYECNTARLMKRLAIVSDIYSKKSQFTSSRGCVNLNIRSDVEALKDTSGNYKGDLSKVNLLAKNLDDKNEELECQLY